MCVPVFMQVGQINGTTRSMIPTVPLITGRPTTHQLGY